MTTCARLLTACATALAVAGGPVLAQATYTDYGPNLMAPSGQCSPIELTIRGRRHTPLIGGLFVEQLQRLLDVSLTRS
jgi:hypothetical protein